MIVAFANQKGGVAKTTTAVNVAGHIAQQGHKVLLVDADPQGSLSVYLDVRNGGMDEVMSGRAMGEIVVEVRPNLFLAPASIQLASTELQLMAGFNREYRLRDALANVAGYDHIFIDCPPSLGLLTINALAAANAVAIVMSTDLLAFEGVKLLYESLQVLKGQINPSLQLLGLIRTRYDGRTTHSSLIASKAADLLSPHLHIFQTLINERTAHKDAAATHQLIYEYAPGSPAANDYSQLSEEVLHAITQA
jgi:chromosome partitioning protein